MKLSDEDVEYKEALAMLHSLDKLLAETLDNCVYTLAKLHVLSVKTHLNTLHRNLVGNVTPYPFNYDLLDKPKADD